MSILSVSNISKSFANNHVIRDLSFEVEQNCIYGFLGQNGAGKTTVMKMILGLQKIDSGKIMINGQEVKFGQTATNKDIGYLADVPAFYDFLTAREYLNLCGKISKFDQATLEERITNLLDLVGLDDNKVRIKGYSRGMKQRLGIAQALLNKPMLLICDEPTSALDPIGRKQILDILKKAASETTIIFSTHILSDVERICDYVGILNNGSLVINGEISTLTSKYLSSNYQLSFTSEDDLNNFISNSVFKVTNIEENTIIIADCELQDIYKQVTNLAIYPNRIETIKPNLESVFLEVTNESV